MVVCLIINIWGYENGSDFFTQNFGKKFEGSIMVFISVRKTASIEQEGNHSGKGGTSYIKY
jgi:hypothetical protein